MSTARLLFDLIQKWESLPWNTGTALQKRLSSWANGVTWYESYADGREAPKGIVAANWNDLEGEWDPVTRTRAHVSDVPSRMCDLFEKYGVEIEWSDQVSSCDGCGKCIQTEPDSYSWQPEFVVGDGDITCAECAGDNAGELLEAIEGDPSQCWSIESIDPVDHGYVKVNEDSYESGWHPGQTDDPRKVARELKAKGVERFIFVKDENSQFYSKWSVYVHESENDILVDETSEASEEDDSEGEEATE
jgi:uncharacterized cysteine cluster protein YcgN (CxxCxxCC family)